MHRKLFRLITHTILRFYQGSSIIMHKLINLTQYYKLRPSNSCITTHSIISITYFIFHNPIKFPFLSLSKVLHFISWNSVYYQHMLWKSLETFIPPHLFFNGCGEGNLALSHPVIFMTVLSQSIPVLSCHMCQSIVTIYSCPILPYFSLPNL